MAIYGGGGEMGGTDDTGVEIVDEVGIWGKRPGMSARFGPGGTSIYSPGSGTNFDTNVGMFDPSSYIKDFMGSPYARMIKPSRRKNKDSQEATGSEQTFEGTKEQETGIFGGTIGPKFKKFFGKLASIHPATRNAKFAYDFIRGLRNAKDPKSFVGGVMKRLALGKALGGLGVSGMQRQGLGSLVNMARGKQTLGQ